MFRELIDPIVYWNRYKGANGGRRYIVGTKDGHGRLGVDKDTGVAFIDTTCTFFFESFDEACYVSQRYYALYKMIYPYVIVRSNGKGRRCVHFDGSPIIHDKQLVESQPMVFK